MLPVLIILIFCHLRKNQLLKATPIKDLFQLQVLKCKMFKKNASIKMETLPSTDLIKNSFKSNTLMFTALSVLFLWSSKAFKSNS